MREIEPTWEWVISAAALALVVGFWLGWRTLDRRIRKKYGGLRIY
jgi:phosphate/sulfate permease